MQEEESVRPKKKHKGLRNAQCKSGDLPHYQIGRSTVGMVGAKRYRKKSYKKIEQWIDNEISFPSMPRNLGSNTRAKLRESRIPLVGFSTKRPSECVKESKKHKDLLRKEGSRILKSKHPNQVKSWRRKEHRLKRSSVWRISVLKRPNVLRCQKNDGVSNTEREGNDEPVKPLKKADPQKRHDRERKSHLSKASGYHIQGTDRKEPGSICGWHGYQEQDGTRLDPIHRRNIVDSQEGKYESEPQKVLIQNRRRQVLRVHSNLRRNQGKPRKNQSCNEHAIC
ncbi:hypothetical protein Tco_0998691 [Tanacetum coccineum]